jgi:hypothetical protein
MAGSTPSTHSTGSGQAGSGQGYRRQILDSSGRSGAKGDEFSVIGYLLLVGGYLADAAARFK